MTKSEYWQRHVVAQRSSGLTQARYCAREGISASQLGYWAQKEERATSEAPGRFLAIRTSALPLELVVGKVTIRVPSGSDLGEVRRMVEALSC